MQKSIRFLFYFAVLGLVLQDNAFGLGRLLNSTTQALSTHQQSSFLLILIAFLAGFLTSLLPCIYPMIPITIGVIQSQGAKTVSRNFQLTFAYVNGLAFIYSCLGYLAATFALIFGSWLGKPWFLVLVVLLLVYLAGSMIGFYTLYIPSFLQTPSVRVEGGSIPQSFLMGMLAAFAASPCLAPPLAFLIAFVSKLANPVLGFALFYAFALGLSSILLIVGTASSTLSLLPRSGAWLDIVKQCMGFIILAMAIHFVSPILGIRLQLGLYASVCLFFVWFFIYKIYKYFYHQGRAFYAKSAIGIALVITILFSLFFKQVFFWFLGIVL